MDAFLVALKAIVDTLGATILLPVLIFIFALVLGTKPGRAFRSAVVIGVAFIGISLVIGLMWGRLSEVSQAMVLSLRIERDIVDVGWPSAAAIAFGSPVGLWVIPISLLVNVVLLALRVTKTLNIDLWNFWHFAFIGSLIVAATGDLALGLVAAAISAAVMLFLADWTAPAVQKFYNLPGISIPHGTTTPAAPIGIVLNKLLDRVPGVNKWDVDPDAVQKRFGPTFGDPMVLGLVIGLVLGVLGFLPPMLVDGDFQTFLVRTLGLGINLAAVMFLLPRMVSILMEGLIPISEAAREFMQARAKGRDVYIGLDSAILIGHPAVISSALVLVPIAILLSVILPGNRVLLFADLAVIPFVVAILGPICRGNIVRIVTIGTVILAIGFYVGNTLAPLMTQVATAVGFVLPEVAVGATYIVSIADGFLWLPLFFLFLAQNLTWIGLAIILVLLAAVWYFYIRKARSWETAAGGPTPEELEAVAAD
ncbi:MAG: PTS transporter subunit IIC [Anaerolineaceae bacterium]|jgi:PTS system galactitol-specific IIC component